ncbi:hypothetical protein LZ016_07265 [Sphingomonas sp. SM33]|uniref:Apea-like HEPN domain-containing protein n=1 Tax=Sphingomonas telluris TaxID=2907998 RepID=A0ABS9VLR1_9SPHN|nr:hypothetical protein [Sphingomonas telluris]MCH8615897.1 hypothetical protein [Sphingomonas telluris]
MNHAMQAVSLLLASMFQGRHPDRLRSSFMFAGPGEPIALARMGTEVNYDSKALLQAALYVRRHGSPHLRSLSMDEVNSRLKRFISDHYYLLAEQAFGVRFSCSYDEHLSADTKERLANAAGASALFVEPRQIVLFPLIPIASDAAFDSSRFFICSPPALADQLTAHQVHTDLVPDSFPPVREWDGIRHSPTSWLGVEAPTLDAAKQIRAAVLGAVALLPHRSERYMFSGRKMFGGYTSFDDRCTISFGDPHTPPLMESLVLDASDREWLSVLAEKLVSPSNEHRRQMRALEYYYRAWAPDPVKRFPTLFAAIDAIFGDASQATQAVVDAVGPVMGPEYTSERIRLILRLRASVIHGGAPNVYESSKYEEYYSTYERDPVRDFELIVARCLQQVVFPAVMSERPHTHADLIFQHTGKVV